MPWSFTVGEGFGLSVARQLADAPERQCLAIFESLRSQRQLSTAVREINHLLDNGEHRVLAERALSRLGFHVP